MEIKLQTNSVVYLSS